MLTTCSPDTQCTLTTRSFIAHYLLTRGSMHAHHTLTNAPYISHCRLPHAYIRSHALLHSCFVAGMFFSIKARSFTAKFALSPSMKNTRRLDVSRVPAALCEFHRISPRGSKLFPSSNAKTSLNIHSIILTGCLV